MAQFYAWMQGARGRASRLGNKISGIEVEVKSYEGEVRVHMWHSHEDKTDRVEVTLRPHGGGASSQTVTLYQGPCNGWDKYTKMSRDELGKIVWDVAHGREITV